MHMFDLFYIYGDSAWPKNILNLWGMITLIDGGKRVAYMRIEKIRIKPFYFNLLKEKLNKIYSNITKNWINVNIDIIYL